MVTIRPHERPQAMRQVAELMLELALAECGRGENPQLGNNRGEDVDTYRTMDGTGKGPGGSGAWCASFVSYTLMRACAKLGYRIPCATSRGAQRLTKNVAGAGRWAVRPGQSKGVGIRAGDVVCWRRGGLRDWRGHVALVVRWQPTTDTLVIIEGNRNNRVDAQGRRYAVVDERTIGSGRWRRKLFGVASLW